MHRISFAYLKQLEDCDWVHIVNMWFLIMQMSGSREQKLSGISKLQVYSRIMCTISYCGSYTLYPAQTKMYYTLMASKHDDRL